MAGKQNTAETAETVVPESDLVKVREALDGIVGRSVEAFPKDLAAAKVVAKVVAKHKLTVRGAADTFCRSKSDIGRCLQAARATADQVKEYKAAGKRQISLSGLVGFITDSGDTGTVSFVDRTVKGIDKCESLADLDRLADAINARKRALRKAA